MYTLLSIGEMVITLSLLFVELVPYRRICGSTVNSSMMESTLMLSSPFVQCSVCRESIFYYR